MGEVMLQPQALSASSHSQLMSIDAATGAIEFHHNGAPAIIVRDFIRKMARDLMAIVGTAELPPVKHTFLDGVYMREMFIPKGTLLIGKAHRLDCINIVSTGDISVMTEDGSGRVTAGSSAVSRAGTQKIGFAHQDTVFINIFRTDETDLARIESAIAYDSIEEFDLLNQLTTQEVQPCQ
ncbi:MAG: hypothetical protein ACRYGK_15485 [Janthinobacterium lividum]